MFSQGTQKCSLGLGQEHKPCAKHQSGGEVDSPNIIGPCPGGLVSVGSAGVGGVMTIGGLDGVGGGVGGSVTVTGGLIVCPAPHSSSDSSELSTQSGDPSHFSPYRSKKMIQLL